MSWFDQRYLHFTQKQYSIEERVKKLIFGSQCFDVLKEQVSNFDNFVRDHIVPLKGDIVQERFGLSEQDYLTVTSEVNVIINNAASV